ncbi:MAG: hypothetical protein WAK11_11500 [Candidatus Cybelea sp.]
MPARSASRLRERLPRDDAVFGNESARYRVNENYGIEALVELDENVLGHFASANTIDRRLIGGTRNPQAKAAIFSLQLVGSVTYVAFEVGHGSIVRKLIEGVALAV